MDPIIDLLITNQTRGNENIRLTISVNFLLNMACFDEQWPWTPHKESMSVNQDIFVFLFAYIATYIILVQRDFFVVANLR